MSSDEELSKTDQNKENKDIKDIKDIVVYTDGSCMKHKKCGYGIYFPNKELKNMSRSFTKEPFTNQRAELYAIYKALNKITKKLKFKNIYVYSDSEYSIKSITIWIKNWKKNDWKTSNNKLVMNQDIIKKIDKIMEKYKGRIIFTHVYSHTGKTDEHSLGNAKADELATKGAQK